jgi:succinoglycan biosynthesis protein ExoA
MSDEKKTRISIVMPCLNEEERIGRVLESLTDDFVEDQAEIIVVDGLSNDRTRAAVEEFARKKGHLSLRILDNPRKLQSHGLNIGIAAASGEIIVRADAHCLYPAGYVRKCIRLLETKDAENAGGVQVPSGTLPIERAIAAAMRHPVGMGDARFRQKDYEGYAEGAFVGTFWKRLFREIGGYDPRAHPNEDGELNMRILEAGKKIYVDGSIQVAYYPRRSLAALAGQYFHYGQGRAYTTWKHRRLTSWRQVGPSALVVALAISIAAGAFAPGALLFPAAYVVSLLGISLVAKFPESCRGGGKLAVLKMRLLRAVAWAVMHVSWGVGFIGRSAKLLFARRSER